MTLPTASEAWIDPIIDAVISEVQRTGYFEKVQGHEPKRKPSIRGLTAAVWVQGFDPIKEASGLAATAARITFNVRLYSNMLKEPQDGIDPNLLRALSSIMRGLHDDYDFGLDPIVRNVDLLGSFGIALSATAGYLEQDGTVYRVYDLLVPVICNDVWPQVK